MKIGITADHRGYNLKEKLIKYLEKKGHETIDYGTNSTESVDYPDFAFKLGEEYINKSFDYGIAICGNGIGISIACNKVKGIRCAKVDNDKEARSAREHNDANIIAIGTDKNIFEVKDIVDAFLSFPFSGEERHIRRIKKIEEYEKK
ncbi:MAG TPA: RpiB/LacA/LacB family sugar-phosphate isomerase [Mollicutes bacterium]|jgi:ribose 5-phosphate isomerase B|nr:RpiB/LacA/LacB family sugar-phosphate isomerase [Mollicutes bacterium]